MPGAKPREVDGDDLQLLPLTPAQRGMWFAEKLSDDYSVNIAQYVDIRHEPDGLDLDLFAQCCEELGPVLESPFVRLTEVDGVPMQYVDVEFDQHINIIDFRDEPDPAAAATDWMQADYRTPVDLINGQFIVISFLRVADDRTFWYSRCHHIILDGYGALAIMRRAVARFNAVRRGELPDEKPPATMAEIVEYEQAYADSTRRTTDRQYWLERVQDLPEPVTLSHVATSAPVVLDSVVVSEQLDPVLQSALETTARECNSSMAVVLTAAFGAFLARMTGVDDIVLSLPVTGRSTAKIKRSAGMVSNVLPIRLRSAATGSVRELIAAAQLQLTGALRHQRYRSDDIKRDAGLDGSTYGFGPRINMVFFDEPITIDGAEVEYRILTSGMLEDLLVNLYQASPQAPLSVDLHGSPLLYTPAEMESHHWRLLRFVAAMVSDLDASVADVDLLLPGEREELGRLQSGVAVEWPDAVQRPARLVDAFVDRARVEPERIAIADDTREWTYGEFSRLCTALAARLAADGVRPGDRVAVALDRGIEQVVALYAVLGVGAAYVPIDPSAPAVRREAVIASATPALCIDVRYLRGIGFSAVPGEFVYEGPLSTGATRGAYVIFTSGSTGVPKGVDVSMAAVANRLAWMQRNHPISVDDKVLYKTPFTFDVSVWELFWPLQVGATMVIARAGGHRDPDYLRRLIVDRDVTTVHFVPSMLDVFVDAVPPGTPAMPASVRRVFTSGEALPTPLAHRVVAESDAQLVNMYGPTEAAVEVTEYPVTGGEPSIPIGHPVPNTSTYVLDPQFRVVPLGVAGELYLAGVQLADGYTGQPGVTAGRFVANPYLHGQRMYRTGDLVRWNADGDLEFLGRTDFQVKIRGQRVELGEIESTLLAEGSVDSVAVVVREDAGAPAITAYVRSRATGEDAQRLTEQLLRWCRRQLPRYMVPSAVVVLESFPVNPSGKLDRSALPVPQTSQIAVVDYVAPHTDAQRRLIELIGELVPAERIGLRDNIFALGADSLIAARLAARLRNDLGVAVALNDIFESADVAELADRLTGAGSVDEWLPLAPMPRTGPIPVAYAQTRLWFINRLDPMAPTYNMPGAVELTQDVDLPALRAAVLDVADRHESLRTRFPSADGEPVQDIVPTSDIAGYFPVNVKEVAAEDLSTEVAALAATGFDLTLEVPLRVSLLRSAGTSVLVLVLHHIAGDGASLRPLIADLLAAYTSRVNGHAPAWEPLPIQYADYALWQRAVLGEANDPDSRLATEVEFWKSELAGMPEVIALPTDRPRPRTPSGRGAYVDTTLPSQVVTQVRALAAQLGVTTFTVLHAALATVLSRLADSDDIAIGTAVAGRDEPETAGLVGMFVNTVVLRNGIRPASSVSEVIADAHRTRTRALAHSQVPFEQVVDGVASQRSLAHSPLFQVSLTLQRDTPTSLTGDAEGVTLLDARPEVAKTDLAVTVIENVDGRDNAMHFEFCYATDIFDRASIEDIADYVERMIVGMVADADQPIGRIDILPPSDVGRLTALPRPIAHPDTLREVIKAGAALSKPLAPAVLGNDSMTHELFGARTNQIARELIARGIGAGDVVAISIPRSHHSVAAMVAVAKSGAAFVMIDPRHPADRRAELVADAGAALGLTTTDVAERAAALPWLVLDAEDDELQIAGHSGRPVVDGELVRPVYPDNIAYVLFTSGSTGKPKAAVVNNRAIASLTVNAVARFGMSPASRTLHVGAPSFDGAMGEVWNTVLCGGTIVVADFETFAGHELERLIAEHGATHAFMTPAAVATLDPARVPTLTAVACGGEALPPELVHRWVNLGNRQMFNIYGPTEAAVWVTCDGPYTLADDVTIGIAGAGVGVLVLDGGLRPVPDGVAGEMYLLGEQVGLGYLGRGDATASTFVASPFGHGLRMYRTGDRVTRRPDGRFEYHGRTDFQLKIRGQRIEPGELDAMLLKHPDVTNAVSLGIAGPTGETVLASYVSLVEEARVTGDELVDYIAERLPSFLVPRALRIVDEFARTPVGKIDRTQLPAIEFVSTQAFVAPRTQLESVVADIFCQVLGVDRVSVNDNFFDLGGNSLSATKVSARIGAVVDRHVPVVEVFDAPTVAKLADRVSGLISGHAAVPLGPRPRASVVPVSGVQRGMWLLNRADPASPAYNIALALRLEGSIDLDAMRMAIADLVARHESLRTSYPMINGEPSQLIGAADGALSALRVEPVDVTGPLEDAIARVSGVGFDVTVAPPVRLAVLRVSPSDHVVVLVMHHISADGASMAPMARDLMTAYASRSSGTAPAWSPLRVQYADFTLWQLERLATIDESGTSEERRQLDYWRNRLAGAPEMLTLPTDHPRPATPTFDGALVPFEIPVDLVRRLEAIAHEHNTTLFMVTQAAYAILIGRLAGSTDVVVGTPYVGRSDPALDDVIGMFVNTLALRTRIDPGESFLALLARLRADDLADMANSDVAFDTVAAQLGVPRTAAFNPVYQVMFWFQNLDFPSVALGDLTISRVPEQLTAAKVDLQLTLYPNDPAEFAAPAGATPMRGELLYATDLFTEDTVTSHVQRYLRILEQLAADPAVIVGDISIATDKDTSASAAPAAPVESLAQIVAAAAAGTPDAPALADDETAVTFGALSAMATAMSAALPDADSALVTALMSLVPPLASAEPDELGKALEVIRVNATLATTAQTDTAN